MEDKLEQVLQGYRIESAYARKLFMSAATIKNYSKNDHIFMSGKKNNKEYLLLSGILHRYNISDKGDEVTTGFYLSSSVITPHFARSSNGNSIFNLQTLTDSVVAEIAVEDLDNLRHSNLEYNEFGKRIIESELSRTFYNETVFRSFNAKERLLALRDQYPNLENLISHRVIASYLGITKVSFSRLRNELSRR